MIEDLHIDDDLPIPATTGWEEMNALLNREMPVKKISRKFILFSLLPVAVLLIVFLAVSVKLNRDYYAAKFYHTAPAAQKNISNNTTFSSGNTLLPTFGKEKRNNIIVAAKQMKQPYLNENLVHSVIAENTNLHIDTPANVYSQIIAAPLKYQPIIKKNYIDVKKTSVPVSEKKPSIKKWDIYAGAGVNISTVGDNNYQPYPVVSFRYNLSPHIFLSSGLSILSPAQGKISGVSKIVNVNDVINNTREYHEIKNYRKLLYADIPLSLGVRFSKSFSVQAGLQTSFLLSKKSSTQNISYDFQMNRIEGNGVGSFYSPTAAVPTQFFNVKAPLMDYRLISGINYQMNEISIGLQYQGSLRKTTIPKNNLLSLHLYYQLK